MKLKLIACGVFEPEMRALVKEVDHEVVLEFLPQGLHAKPYVLRTELQKLIDATSPSDGFNAIAVGYGLCGRGVAGVRAHNVPLIIPRIHDCIAGFLGSHQRYMREFSKTPGTYWFTRRFIQSGGQPGVPGKHRGISAKYEEQYEEYEQRYGEETARYLVEEWAQGWMKNYSRAAFVPWDYPEVDEDRALTKRCAARLGWDYEELPADLSMIRDLLAGRWTPERFLEVLPGEHVVAVHDARIIAAQTIEDEALGAPEDRWELLQADSEGVRPFTADGGGTTPSAVPDGRRNGLGIGIDAGGTFTDIVLYDFAASRVVTSAKAPTTPANPAEGVEAAFAELPGERLNQVTHVTMATTFATNAIVEDKGRTVGLLLVGYDDWSVARIDHRPIRRVAGSHHLDGTIAEELDEAAVRAAVDAFAHEDGAEAIAVVEHNGCRSPQFEKRAAEIATERFSGPVQSAYELTDELDRLRRATTVAINGRIAPIIVDLVNDIRSVMATRGVHAALSVVRADGSVLSAREACRRPVEMVLSGPAASICGARSLTGEDNAIVLDMGGTTSDAARLEDGRPLHNKHGAVVGGHRTTVRAPALLTSGLGGDSRIQVDQRGEIQIGPRRSIPLCVLAERHPEVEALLEELHAAELAELSLLPAAELYVLQREPRDRRHLTDRESGIVDILLDGPASILGLARGLDYPYLTCIPTDRLEQSGIIIRSGFTPTDLLHANGSMSRWNADAARMAAEHLAERMGVTTSSFIDQASERMVRLLARVLLSVGLDLDEPRTVDANHLSRRMFESAVAGVPDVVVQHALSLSVPVIGIGAPAHAFIPEAAARLGTTAVIPESAGVAGAVGAITGAVTERISVLIKPVPTGFTVHAPDEARTFETLKDARGFARERAIELARERAERAGAERAIIRLHSADHTASLGKGGTIYLESIVEAEAIGAPLVTVVP